MKEQGNGYILGADGVIKYLLVYPSYPKAPCELAEYTSTGEELELD